MKTMIRRVWILLLLVLVAFAPQTQAQVGGTPIWTNHFNGSANGSDQANAISVDSNGNVFVTGSSTMSNGTADYATIKYSSAGVPLWTNYYNGPGNGNDVANAIGLDTSGNVFVTGYSLGLFVSDDFATVAYSSAGVPLWTNRYSGPNYNPDQAVALAVDSNGNVFVTGASIGSSGGPGYDYATVAYSGAGVPLWTNRFNGPRNYSDRPAAVAVDGSGNVFVTGYSSGAYGYVDDNYATIAYSSTGLPLWTNYYNRSANLGTYLQCYSEFSKKYQIAGYGF